jgi:dolichyl-diphosphooligosaccharide--protein glycosyltransferase
MAKKALESLSLRISLPLKNYFTIILLVLLGLFIVTGALIATGWHSLIFIQPIVFTGMFLASLGHFGTERKTLAMLFLIFLLGYSIRCQNVQPGYEYFFAFDSYYHARMTGYVIKDGAPPHIDNMAYYELPEKDRIVGFDGRFFWYFSTAFYKLFALGTGYNKHLLVEFVKVFPAFLGAFISILMFFLAKELFGKKAGFVSAFVAATVPSYVYRTMAGFFEDDALGFFGFVAGFIFFFRALKEPKLSRKSIINALLAGFFFAFMGWSWSFYLVIPILLILSLPFILLLFLDKKFSLKKEQSSALAFILHAIIPIVVFAVLLFPFRSFNWFFQGADYLESVMPFEFKSADIGFTLGLAFILFALGFLAIVLRSLLAELASKNLLRIIATIFLFASFGFIVIATVINPDNMFSERFVEKGIFMSTVGEESPGINTFGYKYNTYIIFPALALFFIPLWVFFKKDDFLSPFAFWWIATALVMAWYKLKFTYVFGLPIALAAGFVTAGVFHMVRKYKGAEPKIIAALLLFLLISGIGAASYFVLQRAPLIETQKEWKNVMHWIEDNTPQDAKFLNWWSYGHWLTFIAERRVFADNRNIRWDISDGEFARFIISEDLNEALTIIKTYKPDYILLSSDMFSGFRSMYVYAYKVHQNMLHVDPRTKSKFYASNGVYVRCSVTQQGKYVCGNLTLTEQQMASIPNKWRATPTNLGDTPRWLYRDVNNIGLADLQSAINASMLAKLWFGADEIKPYFELVHMEKGASVIKIFKVKKEAFE